MNTNRLLKVIIELQDKYKSVVTAIKIEDNGGMYDVYFQLEGDDDEYSYINWRTIYHYGDV